MIVFWQSKKKYLGERPEAVENLRKAREMGDLSENGYYKASRQRLSFIDAQLRRLERLVKLGKVVEASGTNRVEIGNTVHVTDGKKEFHYTIVGGYESDPVNKTISYKSPLGSALMGKSVGAKAEVHAPIGTVVYTIVSIV